MEEEYIGYKITTGRTYKVYVSEFNNNKFYKVQVKKKNMDGTETNFYKQLRFAKCDPPTNGEIIRIKKGFEDLYYNNADKYNPISVIIVTDYEKPAVEENNKKMAVDQYIANMKETIPAYNENFINTEEADLPF